MSLCNPTMPKNITIMVTLCFQLSIFEGLNSCMIYNLPIHVIWYNISWSLKSLVYVSVIGHVLTASFAIGHHGRSLCWQCVRSVRTKWS